MHGKKKVVFLFLCIVVVCPCASIVKMYFYTFNFLLLRSHVSWIPVLPLKPLFHLIVFPCHFFRRHSCLLFLFFLSFFQFVRTSLSQMISDKLFYREVMIVIALLSTFSSSVSPLSYFFLFLFHSSLFS